MNGVQLLSLMCAMPTTMTAATTTSLSATTTWLTRLENFVPRMSRKVTRSAITIAGRSTTPVAAELICVGSVMSAMLSTSWR